MRAFFRSIKAAAMSVMPRQTMSTGITSRHFFAFEGNWRKFVPSKYESGPEVLIPSFHPVNGERSELSTIEGRTMAMGRSRPRRACIDMANHLAKRFDLALRIEIDILRRIVIVLKLFGDMPVPHADNVARRK